MTLIKTTWTAGAFFWSPLFVYYLTACRCEYIFYRGLYRTSYARVSRGILTDTEMQIGQFVVPKHGTNVTDDSLEARYRRSRKEVLSQHHWFPMEYYGNEKGGGKNGHFYHVFYTPLYYDLPEGAVV